MNSSPWWATALFVFGVTVVVFAIAFYAASRCP
jgi:hypothetical protein